MPADILAPTPRARGRRRLILLLLAVAMAGGIFAALPAAPTTAGWIPRAPVGDYTPHRVWQMKSNCVWAAGVMLLDKWTHGRIRVGQGVLRRASKDKGSSSLYDLAKGIARVTGIRLHFSPGYGDTMTWWQLLDRLEHDGGAVLIGSYARLPAHYTRWASAFARRRDSSHAVFIERYDRAKGRVWLMDPLAQGDFPGEWIDVDALHHFATFEDGHVMAAATPARHQPSTAPLIDHAYRLSGPQLAAAPVAGSTVRVHVGLSVKFGFPAPAAQRFIAHWVPIVPPAPADQTTGPPAVLDSERAPETTARLVPVEAVTSSASRRAGPGGFDAAVPVPAIPGAYRLVIGLAESGHKAPSRILAPIQVEVVPPFAGAVSLTSAKVATASMPVQVRVTVANIGSFDWRPKPIASDDPHPVAPPTETFLTLTWRADDGTSVPAGSLPAELAPGQLARFTLDAVAPPEPGAWTLVVDVVNLERGALSSTGRDLPTVQVLVDPINLAAAP